MKSCFIQNNAQLVENVNVAQEVNALSKKLFCFQTTLNPFQYPLDTCCFDSVTRQCSPCLYQFGS